MKIKLQLPADAQITYDEATRELVVTPFFTKTAGNQPFGYVQVLGEGGAEQRAVLQVSGKTGKPSCWASKERRVQTKFDSIRKSEVT